MVKSARIRALEHGLNSYIRPALEAYGFKYFARTHGFYRQAGDCIQIIEFQPGVRSAEGSFTVNLAIYHPVYHEPSARVSNKPREYDCLMDFRQRLGPLRETLRTRLFKRLFSDPSHWMTWWLTNTSDQWWPFSADDSEVLQSLKKVLNLLEAYGIPWLEKNTHLEAMKVSHSSILMRSEKNR